jgi:transketolase
MEHTDELIRDIEKKTDNVRRNVLSIFESSEAGHAGGTLSLLEIASALYFHHLKFDPANCDWAERDRLVLSKAHCCEAIYAILVELGVLPRESLCTYYCFGSPLQGHADRWCTPGIDYSGGSLGQGLSFAAGSALAEKMKTPRLQSSEGIKKFMPRYIGRYNPLYRVFCILGDGECNEGEVWEAAMFAAKFKLDNLIAIVDYNKYSLDGPITDIMPIEPFMDKWKAFGWWVTEIDGHNLRQIVDTLDLANRLYGDNRPKCIIAHTVKGQGVPLWEQAHTHIGRAEEIAKGCKEGRAKYGRI